MDLKNKYMLITLRLVFGAFMIFASIAGFIGAKAMVSGSPMEGVSEKDIQVTITLWDTGILHLVKLVELIAGLMFVFNFLPALAAIFMAPLSIGFVVYNILMGSTSGTIISMIIALINMYFGYVYWDKYKSLFQK